MEKKKYKEDCKKVIIDYLTTIGYPDISNEKIMQELTNIYRALEENNLVRYGLTFQKFHSIIEQEYIKERLLCQMKEGFFGRT